jgi:hypothetical protein
MRGILVVPAGEPGPGGFFVASTTVFAFHRFVLFVSSSCSSGHCLSGASDDRNRRALR